MNFFLKTSRFWLLADIASLLSLFGSKKNFEEPTLLKRECSSRELNMFELVSALRNSVGSPSSNLKSFSRLLSIRAFSFTFVATRTNRFFTDDNDGEL